MSIAYNLEIENNNLVKIIKKMKKGEERDLAIGALIADLGSRSINAVSKFFEICWRKAKKCYEMFINGDNKQEKIELRGRKKVTDKYPKLEDDIRNIIDGNSYTDPHFETENQYVKLTLKKIMERLISTGKYQENFIGKSTLDNLLKKLGYNLKEVKRCKPLKKIKETDQIFENVNKRKAEALNDSDTALISIDTKDKVLIGPYSRGGKSRVQIEACDHELTNHCIIPFGILDLKNNQPYFYNFENKPTSLAIVDCLENYIIQNNQYNKIAILLDNGPDNSGVRTAFLKGLVDLVNRYKIEIELIYYPPYHSKYNPVERLWARLEMLWNGMLLTSEEKCYEVMSSLTWKKITAKVTTIEKVYEKGVTYTKDEMSIYERVNIIRDNVLKKWSIFIKPSKVNL